MRKFLKARYSGPPDSALQRAADMVPIEWCDPADRDLQVVRKPELDILNLGTAPLRAGMRGV